MKIILDENLPRPLKAAFGAHTVTTVQEEGLAGTVNGELLQFLEGIFDVFITGDKNLRDQQNLTGRTLAIVELPTNRLPLLRPIFSKFVSSVDATRLSEYVVIELACSE